MLIYKESESNLRLEIGSLECYHYTINAYVRRLYSDLTFLVWCITLHLSLGLIRIELTTSRLSIDCSTIELQSRLICFKLPYVVLLNLKFNFEFCWDRWTKYSQINLNFILFGWWWICTNSLGLWDLRATYCTNQPILTEWAY